MPQKVIALTIGTASIPMYREDWPALKAAVEEAIAGRTGCVQGEKERIVATPLTVADRSQLATDL